tara:strand:- start:245 stop:508 length:264 start_codon:yes stop_codon:yes gene_type:complete
MKPTKTKYVTRITRLSILPDDEPIFSELCTHVSIQDDAAGEFVEVSQDGGRQSDRIGSVSIDPNEWPVICEAIEKMIGYCKQNNDKE